MNSYSDSFPQKDLRSLRETPINQEVGFCLWMGALFPFFLKARADRLRVGGVDTKLLGKVFIVMCWPLRVKIKTHTPVGPGNTEYPHGHDFTWPTTLCGRLYLTSPFLSQTHITGWGQTQWSFHSHAAAVFPSRVKVIPRGRQKSKTISRWGGFVFFFPFWVTSTKSLQLTYS